MRLRRPCPHGRYDPHYGYRRDPDCPGGEFLPEDALVIEKVGGEWPEWATDRSMVRYELHGIEGLLDDLAAPQVGKPE